MGIKILLVEDTEIQQQLAKMALSALKHQVDIVSTGSEAVEKCLNGDYDFVFMDIGLPDFNGIEATRLIRKHNQTIPIVALTAHSEEKTKIEAIEAGMNAYEVKPINSAKAEKILAEFVKG